MTRLTFDERRAVNAFAEIHCTEFRECAEGYLGADGAEHLMLNLSGCSPMPPLTGLERRAINEYLGRDWTRFSHCACNFLDEEQIDALKWKLFEGQP